jgi:hypothetical protein
MWSLRSQGSWVTETERGIGRGSTHPMTRPKGVEGTFRSRVLRFFTGTLTTVLSGLDASPVTATPHVSSHHKTLMVRCYNGKKMPYFK